MEFRYLSEVTGDPKFAQKVNGVFDLMASKQPPNGLYPTTFDTTYGRFRDHRVSFGGLGDSFYEYMLKVWLQGGRKEPQYRRMFDGAMDGMMKEMLKRSKPSVRRCLCRGCPM
jgi:mannosyl-oligosaccharide alpha-1,2-mannosidase